MNAATRAYLIEHRQDAASAVAAALAADLTTARNILTDDLSGYLTGTGLFTPFLAYKSGQLPAELEAFRGAFANLDYILSNLRGRPDGAGGLYGGFVRTTDASIAAQMAQMLAGFEQVGLLTREESAGFIGLGGGYLLDRLTVDEIETAWSEADDHTEATRLRAALGAGYNAAVEAVDDGERDPEALIAWLSTELT